MKRINGIEYLRVVAISGIIIDHYFGGSIGRFMGEIFFCVFFAISALLFGLKWKLDDQPQYNMISFLYARFIRLSTAYYPFIIVSILFLIYFSVPITIPDVLLNLFYLSWFGKLYGLGHLWFLTMLLACYVFFALLSKVHSYFKLLTWVVIGCFCLILQIFIKKIGLPGYLFLILFYCGLLFVFADKFEVYIKKIKTVFLIPGYIIINLTVFYIYIKGYYIECSLITINSFIISKWLGTVCGFANLILFINLFDNVRVIRTISYLSIISYEIYLVHKPLILCKFYLNRVLSSQTLSFLVYIVITLISAHLLMLVSKYLGQKLLENGIST